MKMKKRNKLQWLAFMLVAALMMTFGTPTVSARAMLDQVDSDEDISVNVDFYGGSGVFSMRGGSTATRNQAFRQAKVATGIPHLCNIIRISLCTTVARKIEWFMNLMFQEN